MQSPPDDDRRCGACRHFMDDPEQMERELPGIQALGSMYGSVRGDSGFCRVLDRFSSPGDVCDHFEAADDRPPR